MMAGIEKSIAASGILADFNAAGYISPAGIHLERTLRRLGGEGTDPGLVGLAIALTARALEHGSACLPVSAKSDLPTLLAAADVDDPEVERLRATLSWPSADQWLTALSNSPLIALGDDEVRTSRPLRLVDEKLYFERVWQQQEDLAHALTARLKLPVQSVDEVALNASLERIFPADLEDPGQARQRLAVESALLHSTSVIAGGPGTGKTTSVQRLLAVLDDVSSGPQRVALAALSGKAAARMREALDDPRHGISVAALQHVRLEQASTLHRLLGSRGRIGFEHDATNPLPHDWVIVDEVSMISLPMMVQLLSALRPTTRLVLLGDPDQLSSIEVGAVLSDIVAAQLPASMDYQPLAGADHSTGLDQADVAAFATFSRTARAATGDAPSAHESLASAVALSSRAGHRYATQLPLSAQPASLVTTLEFNYRFADHPGLVQLAHAVKFGDLAAVESVLADPSPEIEFIAADPARLDLTQLPELRADLIACGEQMLTAALTGDAEAALAALGTHRLLCANARGPYGVSFWTQQVERALAEQVEGWGRRAGGAAEPWNPLWYPGRPLLITANSAELGIFNGDTGVLIEQDDSLVAVIGTSEHHRSISPYLLENIDTMHALTIHKSQGSQYRTVTIVLPPAGSKILTRELLYTGITRAMDKVRIIGTVEAVKAATMTPALRASGLSERLKLKAGS